MRRLFQLAHHCIAHPLVGLSWGRLWAWRFHRWTHNNGWPSDEPLTEIWQGLE